VIDGPTEDTHLGFLRREGAGPLDDADAISATVRSTLLKHCPRVVAIRLKSKPRQGPLSSSPVAAASGGFHARKSLGNVEIDLPRCVGAPTHEHSGRLNWFPLSRASLGPNNDIWIEDSLTEEGDATNAAGPDYHPIAARSNKCGPSRHTQSDLGRWSPRELSKGVPKRACEERTVSEERTVPEERSPVWQSPVRAQFFGLPSRHPQRSMDSVTESRSLQFTPPRSVACSRARTSPLASRHRQEAAPPTTDVVAQTTVHRVALSCWKALCRAVIPADCCGVSPPPQTKVKARRRSRFRRSVGELVVRRTVIVGSPWFDAEEQEGYYDSGEDVSSEDEEDVANSCLVDQIKLPRTVAGERLLGLGAHPASTGAALPSSGGLADEGEAALPLLSNRDETLSSRLTLQRSVFLNDLEPNRGASKSEETGEFAPCWAEAERLTFAAQTCGELATTEDTPSPRCRSSADAQADVPVPRRPCWATADQVPNSRLEMLLSTLSADDERVEPRSCEVANTFTRSSEDEGGVVVSDLELDDLDIVSVPAMAVPRRALFLQTDRVSEAPDEKALISKLSPEVRGA